MYSPHTVTLYYVTEDPVTFETMNHVTILRGVLLDASKMANVKTSGLESADSVNLYIPFSAKAVDGFTGEKKTFVGPKEFEAMADKRKHWTLDIGNKCFFVKGEVVVDQDFQFINLNYDNVHRVTKVDAKDFGTPDMQHWEVGGA